MRILLGKFEDGFEAVHSEGLAMLAQFENDPSNPETDADEKAKSVMIVRSAAKVEQCFGGLSTRLWDDPFEWTLPESLASAEDVAAYLAEVKATRVKGFELLRSDADLSLEVPAPEELRTIFEVLLKALIEANRFIAKARQVSRHAD